MAISVPYTFSPNTTILSAQVNGNFSALTVAVNTGGDTMTGALNTQNLLPTTTATYDLGSSSFKYRDLNTSRNASIGGTLAVTGAATLSSTLAVTGATTLSTALGVASGGTGASTLTAHGLLLGEGTSAIAAAGTGTTGQLMASQGASSDPAFTNKITQFYEGTTALTISSNVLTIDLSTANVFTFTFNANITTTTFTNPPADGPYVPVTFIVTANGSSFTWSFLTSTVIWDGGVAPAFVTTNGHVMKFVIWTTAATSNNKWRGIIIASNYAS